MFPIKDHNPSGRTPFVTYALIAINIAVFLYTFFAIGSAESALTDFYDSYALRPDEVTAGTDLITLITSMFLHGGWMHLLGNMLFLYIYGDNLESRLGHIGYLIFYLVTGLAASGLQIATNPDSAIFNLGASGAIAGVMGGYILLYPKAKIDVLIFLGFIFSRRTLPAWMLLGYWFGLQIFSGIGSLGGPDTGGVAFWAHAGGFIAGALLILPFWLKDRGKKKTFVKAHWRDQGK